MSNNLNEKILFTIENYELIQDITENNDVKYYIFSNNTYNKYEIFDGECLNLMIMKFINEDKEENIIEFIKDIIYEDESEYEEDDEFDNIDNDWRYSNYEEKDIEDWDVDDHLAAWYDHMMEK